MYMFLNLVLALLAQSVLAFPSVFSHDQKRWGQQYEETNQLGATASESSVCSRIGVDLIKDGGNAADAVSTQLPPPIITQRRAID